MIMVGRMTSKQDTKGGETDGDKGSKYLSLRGSKDNVVVATTLAWVGVDGRDHEPEPDHTGDDADETDERYEMECVSLASAELDSPDYGER